ncbi:hypothetical protein AB6A40_009768 [Gnathostoma spinigerum]|uniref:Inositol polyphosphate-related phosphatase domain-containing protein n=1 Tax=Gnathostoma spinigerum TaxID=75299 RepID=A0ABD6F073_9BILA
MPHSRSLAARVVGSLSSQSFPRENVNCSFSSSTKPQKESWVFQSEKHADSFTEITECSRQTATTEEQNCDDLETKDDFNFQQKQEIDGNETETSTAQSGFYLDCESNRSLITGPGGVIIPERKILNDVAPAGRIKIICVTWNVASKPQHRLDRIRNLISGRQPSERSDIICICLQELPPTKVRYHQDAVRFLGDSLSDSHIPYCWVRKWSLMVMIFMRTSLTSYASVPKWQFVSSNTITKPMRTKGAIATSFRIFQMTILLVTCHLSYGPIANRLNDIWKICDQLRFSSPQCSLRTFNDPHVVFWFGDLNFRLNTRKRVDLPNSQPSTTDQFSSVNSIFAQLLANDELSVERKKGRILSDFEEAHINFPPTHKFIEGSNDYVSDRIPSYTDRILYFTALKNMAIPLKYDCLWEEDTSDHKPVFGTFSLKVIDVEEE